MPSPERRRPEDLTEEERERVRLAHHRLRKASQELEGLLATKPVRGRWEPTPAPPEVLEVALTDLERAYKELWLLQRDLLGWSPPPGLQL